MQKHMKSFCKAAWLITLWGDCVVRAVNTLTASHDVIHVDSKESIHDPSLSIHLEDTELVVVLGGQADRDVDAPVQLMLEQANFAHQGFVSRFIPLSRCPDVTESRLSHLHDLVFQESNHLCKQPTHVS